MAVVTSAYLMIMAKNALTHIQKTDPAPPIAIADATPAIFPTPSVPESATHAARNGDIPSPLLPESALTVLIG